MFAVTGDVELGILKAETEACWHKPEFVRKCSLSSGKTVFTYCVLPRGWKRKRKGKNISQDRRHSLPICPVYGQSIKILTFKFKPLMSLEVHSEYVGQNFTIYLQVRSSMIFLCCWFVFVVVVSFFFFFRPSFGSCKLHCCMCDASCDLHHCALEIKRKSQLSPAEICISTPESVVTKVKEGGSPGWEGGRGRGGKAAQCTATIPPLSWAAMMSAFWLQTAYLCFNSCQEQQISG